MSEREPRDTIQVIERAAKILRLVGHASDGLTQTEISQGLDLPRSTVHRILRALQREGLVDNPDGSRFRLGPTFADFASSNRQQIIATLHPYLDLLAHELNETVQLAVLEDDHTVLVDQVVGGGDLRVESPLGTIRPLYCTAKGKAILAQLSDEQIALVVPEALPHHTENSIRSREELSSEIASIRDGNCVWSREEWTVGISSISVALPGLALGPASASIIAPSHRLASAEGRFERGLLDLARHVQTSFSRTA